MHANDKPFSCRPGCAACCIAPSITSPIPDADGKGGCHSKPAGMACVQLDAALRCRIFGQSSRPAVCASLQASPDMCGTYPSLEANRAHAMHYLAQLEQATAPACSLSKTS